MKKNIYKLILISLGAFPGFASAALTKSGTVSTSNLQGVIYSIAGIIESRILPILFGLAVLTFIYGLLKYVVSTDDKTRSSARNVILYGVISLFVMVSVWGLVNLIGTIIGIDVLNIDKLDTNKIDYKSLPVK